MEGWQERHAGWHGGAAELARLAAEVLAELGLPADPRPSERLVRDYVQRGILDRPGREGKEARYGFRHLAQLVAARLMTGDGWPLAKVAEVVGSAGDEGLLAMVPDQRPPTAAEAAVARMRRD